MKKRRALTELEKEDAARLAALIKKDTRSQLEISIACGWKTQGSVSQYSLGSIPLNMEALSRFAAVLGCSHKDISPRLAALMSDVPHTQSIPSREPNAPNYWTPLTTAQREMVDFVISIASKIPDDLARNITDLIKSITKTALQKE